MSSQTETTSEIENLAALLTKSHITAGRTRLRDEFAMSALAGQVQRYGLPRYDEDNDNEIKQRDAKQCYRMADAMLAARDAVANAKVEG